MASNHADMKLFLALRQFWKLIKQILGQENIFGYRSTTSNQLYLQYLICGKIYFADNIPRSVKYSWFVINLCAILIICTTAAACLLYDTKLEIWKLLDITIWLGISMGLGILIPSLVYYYQRDIEEVIQGIDQFLGVRISQSEITNTSNENSIDVNALIIFNFYSATVLTLIHSFVCIADIILFFEEEKVRNFKYYVFALPNTEENGSATLFTFNCLLLVFNSPLYIFTWISGVTLVLLWSTACYNELMYVQNRLHSRMDEWSLRIRNEFDVSRKQIGAFNQILMQDIKSFNTIKRTINKLKGFVQVACSLGIPVNFLSQIAQLCTAVSTDMPLSVRIKVISFFILIFWPMFLLYWAGQILENGISAVSLSVYCSPWHYSVEVRRNVLIFLGQTQRPETLFMWKVYPLVFRNFAKLLHSTQATVNLLRKTV